ncbi:MAG: PEGA domain-containing protein [Candidatus Krumholzibacteriia bacterium]
MRSTHALIALVVGLTLLVACGSEPPTPGALMVTSVPSGAAVTLDGSDTGLLTPATITDLEGGMYTVAVSLADVEFRPAEKQVEVFYGGLTTSNFQTESGIINVTSEPGGAAIILDDEETGQVTPYTFASVDPGTHTVDLRLPYHRTSGGPQTVEAEIGVETGVDFDLVLGTVVMFEGFSNVRCGGCPALVNDIASVQNELGFGFDHMVYVKYAGPVPYPLDPMYRSNRDMVDDRSGYYSGQSSFALPTLFTQGTLSGGYGTPIDAAAMATYITAAHAAPVDFYLAVATTNLHDLGQSDVGVEIQLVAPYTAVDLSQYSLRAVLMYDEVTTEVHYEPGGDEYHWVARADAEVAASIGNVAQGTPTVFNVTLSDPDPAAFGLTPHGREVLVFAQHLVDKSIIQAGSSMISETVVANPGPALSGGSR